MWGFEYNQFQSHAGGGGGGVETAIRKEKN